MQKFKLKGEYIELNKLLKLINWAESGGMANSIISDGNIIVNSEIELRKRYKVKKSDVIEFDGEQLIIE